ASKDGTPAGVIGIYLQSDANALDVAKKVKQVMDEQALHFPPGIEYSIPYATTPFVTESLKEVLITVGVAFVLVVIVVYLFLQSWRATLIPFLGGLTGPLYKQFALTLAVSVILSAILALTFTPAMAALLLRRVEPHTHSGPLGRIFAAFNRLFERSSDGYVNTVAVMQRHAA